MPCEMEGKMIEYRDVGMTYGDNVILKQINLTIQ